MLKLFLLLAVISFHLEAQWLSFGVTGGVPVSPHSETGPSASIYQTFYSIPSSFLFVAPNDFYQKPYAVGAEVEIKLRWQVSFATGMEYERFHRDQSNGYLLRPQGPFGSVPFVGSTAANAFTFPLLPRYNHKKTFFEAGATLRHLGTFSGRGVVYSAVDQTSIMPVPYNFTPQKAIDVAITAGAGLRYRAGPVDLVPELRFHHWTAAYQQPVQNQVMLMFTVAFPARQK